MGSAPTYCEMWHLMQVQDNVQIIPILDNLMPFLPQKSCFGIAFVSVISFCDELLLLCSHQTANWCKITIFSPVTTTRMNRWQFLRIAAITIAIVIASNFTMVPLLFWRKLNSNSIKKLCIPSFCSLVQIPSKILHVFLETHHPLCHSQLHLLWKLQEGKTDECPPNFIAPIATPLATVRGP